MTPEQAQNDCKDDEKTSEKNVSGVRHSIRSDQRVGTALKIIYAGDNNEINIQDKAAELEIYDFFINVDNIYAKMEMKSGKNAPELTRARFVYGMILIALGLLQQYIQNIKTHNLDLHEEPRDDYEDNIEKLVESFSRAIAPILLPMIDGLGTLDLDAAEKATASGETD